MKIIPGRHRQTDGQTTYCSITALCTSASRGNNNNNNNDDDSFLLTSVARSQLVRVMIAKADFYFSAFQFRCTTVLFQFTAQIVGYSILHLISNF